VHDVQRTPYDVLLGEMDQVLAEWRALMRPALRGTLSPARLMDALPVIVPRLVALARSGATIIDEELKERIAREHGITRRADAVPVAMIAEEWGALKRACAQVLARHGFVGSLADDAMQRFEILVDDAIGYTLRGYYAQELDTLRGRGLERRDATPGDRRHGGDRRMGARDQDAGIRDQERLYGRDLPPEVVPPDP
jgi:hypothetical protein